MLLLDKYRPQTLKDIFFHKQLFDLLNTIAKDDAIPNIIFFGSNGVGKKTMIKLFMEMLFDVSVNKTKDVPYQVSGSGNKINIELIKQSNYHIVIDPKNNNSDRYLIHDVVKEYSKRRSLNVFETKRAFKIVVINNLDNLSYYAQTSLRRTTERYNDKCRFIMWCKSLSRVIKPLQSRCICIRIPSPTDIELFKYVFNISMKEKIILTLEQYVTLIDNANGNIKKALWELEFYKHSYKLDNDYLNSINQIIELVLKINPIQIPKIRTIIFNLMITNFDGTVIMRDLIDTICMNKKICDNAKQEIVFDCAEIEYQLVKGRRQIIQFDVLIISIIRILKKYNSKIN